MDEWSKELTGCVQALCKAMFPGEGPCVHSDLVPGDGRPVELGDSLEVQLTQWTVLHQSLGRMIETTRNKDKGIRFKLGGKNFFSGLESGIVGMKKGGRRFIIAPSEDGRKAFDVEITKVKVESERKAEVPGETQLRDRVAKLGQPVMVRPQVPDTPLDMPELEDVSPKSAFSTPRSTRRNSFHEGGGGGGGGGGVRTTPIPIIRSDSPQSLRSGHSSSGVFRPLTQPQPQQFSLGQGSEFNMMMSEARLQNTEIRMNIQRVSDKMDAMLALQQQQQSKQGGGGNQELQEVLAKLELLLAAQSKPSPALVGEQEVVAGYKLRDQADILRRLEINLKEKEEQLAEVARGQEETIGLLQRKLEEQIMLTESVQAGARSHLQSEVKKLMSSTAKLLLSQFRQEEDYSGSTVRETVATTFQLIGDKLAEKYREPPVAAVAPVPAEVEEWEAEDDQ